MVITGAGTGIGQDSLRVFCSADKNGSHASLLCSLVVSREQGNTLHGVIQALHSHIPYCCMGLCNIAIIFPYSLLTTSKCFQELARLLTQHPSISVLLGCQDAAEHQDGRTRSLGQKLSCKLVRFLTP